MNEVVVNYIFKSKNIRDAKKKVIAEFKKSTKKKVIITGIKCKKNKGKKQKKIFRCTIKGVF